MTYAEKVWDTINRAWNGDLEAQLALLCIDIALNDDSRLIKEKKKMLNVDKYREEIMSDSVNRLECYIADLRGVGTVGCAHNLCKMCMQKSFKWLFSEHEPPLLENGDGLKPGDWIMVRDNDNQDWCKSVFLFYLDGEFYCVDGCDYIPKDGYFVNWKQARLPEDGENE